VGDAVAGLAGLLRPCGAFDFGRLGAARLAEHGEQHHPALRRQPVGHAGLLAQQLKAQLTDLPLKVAGVRLAEYLGALGEQAWSGGPCAVPKPSEWS